MQNNALLAGITAGITVALPIRAGFSFSGGAVDMVLSSFTPLAQNPWLLIPVGLVVGVIYYVVFRVVIVKFNLKTPGREPKLVGIQDDMDAFTDMLWNSLNPDNKVSLFVRYIDIATGAYETKIVNKNK